MLPVPPQPYVPGFPCYAVAPAQLTHRVLILFILKHKPYFLFHHTARFPRHAVLLHAFVNRSQCQECPRSVLSGMCPVCTSSGSPSYLQISDYPSGISTALCDI